MQDKFTMSLSLNVLEHLGINLYSNIPAVLSEIVANAWDADAKNVHISFSDDEIIIEDDGCGMSVEDVNDKFLKIGYQKRARGVSHSSLLDRPYMERKGIGKLSMFSIAEEINVYSKNNSSKSSVCGLQMKITDIKVVINKDNSNYSPRVLEDATSQLAHVGTKIILKDLKKKIKGMTVLSLKNKFHGDLE